MDNSLLKNIDNPKITVVTVCFNAAKTLEKTIQSVINQTYNNIEYIIIDGASTDGTLDIIKKYKYRISYWKSEPDKGIYDAMNKGIKAATGEWINFMNAGDMFADKNVLKNIFERDLYEYGVIFGAWFLIYKKHKRILKPFPFFENKNKYKEMGFSHQSVFVKTKFAYKYMFDTALKICADYYMIWNLYYKENVIFHNVEIPISIMDEQTGATIANYELHCKEIAFICGCSISKFYLSWIVFVHRIKRFTKRCIW